MWADETLYTLHWYKVKKESLYQLFLTTSPSWYSPVSCVYDLPEMKIHLLFGQSDFDSLLCAKELKYTSDYKPRYVALLSKINTFNVK